VNPSSGASAKPLAQASQSPSKTYGDTIRMLKAWIVDDDDTGLARLFTGGDARASDLLAACHSDDDRIAVAAFLTLDFLAAPSSASCADFLERRDRGLLYSTAANLSDADVERIDRWVAAKQTPNGYRCGDNHDSDIDDALIYSLILNGSTLSKSVMARMRAFAKLCTGGDAATLIEDSDSLITLARRIAHDLKIEPDISASIRASAFFLPPESRKDCEVVIVARTDNRILLKITYSVGYMGGGIFYIVLRNDGSVWQYALIRRWAYF